MLQIRMAERADAPVLLEIYKPYITDTAITFEYEIPTVEEFGDRIEHTLQIYPYIVAIEDGTIMGYAYASPFKARKAYDWSVETTIYLNQDQKGKGLGKLLYLVMEEILRQQHIINSNACIACTDEEDEHLTNGSVSFHEHMGYRLVGKFTQCGYKFGKWYDMVWMEKMLGGHPENPADIIPAREVMKGMDLTSLAGVSTI